MSDNKNEINMPQLTGRDMELLICALRSAENGFPKVSHIFLPWLCVFGFKIRKLVLSLHDYAVPLNMPPPNTYFLYSTPAGKSTGVLHSRCHAIRDDYDGSRIKITDHNLTIQIDYNKMADMANLKNGRVASACFSQVKKKVMGEAGVTKATAKKETPSKRKQSAAAAADAGDTDESPPKKAKTATKNSAKKQEETKEEDDDDEGSAFI